MNESKDESSLPKPLDKDVNPTEGVKGVNGENLNPNPIGTLVSALPPGQDVSTPGAEKEKGMPGKILDAAISKEMAFGILLAGGVLMGLFPPLAIALLAAGAAVGAGSIIKDNIGKNQDAAEQGVGGAGGLRNSVVKVRKSIGKVVEGVVGEKSEKSGKEDSPLSSDASEVLPVSAQEIQGQSTQQPGVQSIGKDVEGVGGEREKEDSPPISHAPEVPVLSEQDKIQGQSQQPGVQVPPGLGFDNIDTNKQNTNEGVAVINTTIAKDDIDTNKQNTNEGVAVINTTIAKDINTNKQNTNEGASVTKKPEPSGKLRIRISKPSKMEQNPKPADEISLVEAETTTLGKGKKLLDTPPGLSASPDATPKNPSQDAAKGGRGEGG